MVTGKQYMFIEQFFKNRDGFEFREAVLIVRRSMKYFIAYEPE